MKATEARKLVKLISMGSTSVTIECAKAYLEAHQKAQISFGLVKMAKDELGISQPDYPAPVTNAINLLNEALAQWEAEA